MEKHLLARNLIGRLESGSGGNKGGKMANWDYHVKLKHLMTKNEDWESVQTSMTQIGNILERTPCFHDFPKINKFKRIPRGDEFFEPVDYANKLLDEMYAYADAYRIWIE